MKRGFLAFALLACASLVSVFYHIVAEPVIAAYRAARDIVFHGFKLAANPVSEIVKPEVRRIQAKAFTQRIEKRERPVITSAWRMCPSI